jgi:TPP-dependent pyruvate/acetoin dehydrogenase alpha subunit
MDKKSLIDFESRIAKIFNEAKIPYPVHLCGGNEDQLIDIFREIKKEDWVFSTHRPHYHYLLKGGDPDVLEKKILEGNSMYVFDKERNFYSSAIVGGCPGIAAGLALGLKEQNRQEKVWCFVGDGGEDSGHFYEAVRYVHGWKLPCTFIIEDNDLSVETSKELRYGRNSELEWPNCVRRYHYERIWPHVGTGEWVDFTGEGKRDKDEKAGVSF